MSTTNVKYIPKDAQVIMAILKELGINDFDPRVINQLLEFVYWHTTIVLDDARVFANHAKKKNIDVDDVRLAIQMHAEQMSSAGPPRDVLLEVARAKNSTSLPPIKPQSGIRLPPDRYCLTQPNYKLKSNLSTVSKKTHSTTSTSITGSSNSASHQEVKFSPSPVLKQMPMIPPRTSVPSSSFMTKSNLPDTSHSADILLSEGNLSSSTSSTVMSRPDIKKEDIDLMEIDPLTDHI